MLVCPSVFKTGVSSYGDGWVRFLHIPATGVLAEPVSCGVRVSPLPPRAGCLTPFSLGAGWVGHAEGSYRLPGKVLNPIVGAVGRTPDALRLWERPRLAGQVTRAPRRTRQKGTGTLLGRDL